VDNAVHIKIGAIKCLLFIIRQVPTPSAGRWRQLKHIIRTLGLAQFLKLINWKTKYSGEEVAVGSTDYETEEGSGKSEEGQQGPAEGKEGFRAR
jgi:hypothetical protein